MAEIKKLYISADIEGTAGICNWDETEKNHPDHAYFAKQMTREVGAACEGAGELGWEVMIKDAHDSARNLNVEDLPRNTTVIRGWAHDTWCMTFGINRDNYSAAAFTGYHSPAYTEGNSLSHTMTTRACKVTLNGKICSEFMLNAYAAAYAKVPVVFLSGDRALCESAKELIPEIMTVASKDAVDGASISAHPLNVCDEIKETMKKALEPEHIAKCSLELPKHFTLEIMYRENREAYKAGFYPGARHIDAKTVRFETDDFHALQTAVMFIL